MFALGVCALWVSRGREPERNFGNTLEEEVKRSLALVDYQLSDNRRWIMFMLGAASISVVYPALEYAVPFSVQHRSTLLVAGVRELLTSKS
jgi:hypothetical protein